MSAQGIRVGAEGDLHVSRFLFCHRRTRLGWGSVIRSELSDRSDKHPDAGWRTEQRRVHGGENERNRKRTSEGTAGRAEAGETRVLRGSLFHETSLVPSSCI